MKSRWKHWGLTAVMLFSSGALFAAAEDSALDCEKILKMIVRDGDTRHAFKEIQTASKKSPGAMFAMFRIFSSGTLNQDHDRKKAVKFLERAGKQNFFPALLYLIRNYYPRAGGMDRKVFSLCKENHLLFLYAAEFLERKEARERKTLLSKLKRSAARDGDAAAALAYCMLRGNIMEGGAPEAVSLLEKTLKKYPEHGECLYILARCSERGLGTAKDPEKAAGLLRRAVDACCPQAIYHLFARIKAYPFVSSRRERSEGEPPSPFVDEYPFYQVYPETLQYYYLHDHQAAREEFRNLTSKQAETVKKLADRGCIAMIALEYEFHKHGFGLEKPDPETAEKCFEKRKNTCLLHRLYTVLYGSFSSSAHYSAAWRSNCFKFQDRRSGSGKTHSGNNLENPACETPEMKPRPQPKPRRQPPKDKKSLPAPIIEPEDASEDEF